MFHYKTPLLANNHMIENSMDAFSKFFQKRTFSLGNTLKGCHSDSKTRSETSFGKDNVRLFVYRDHDLKGRKLLFDSKSMCRLGETQKGGNCRRKSKDGGSSSDSNTGQPPTDTKTPTKPTLVRDSSESNRVAEMMFGAVAMAYKGPTLKVHTIRTPPQVMITKIFVPVQQPGKDTSVTEGEFDSCSYQSGSSSVATVDSNIPASGPCSAPAAVAHSIPVAVPSPPPHRSLDILATVDTGDSGIVDSGPSSHGSHTTPFPSPSSSSTSSSSYIHRIRRNRNTSLEIHMKARLSDCSTEKPLPASKRPPQIGIGIVFNMPEGQEEKTKHFQNFVFSHITLIEGHVNKMGLIIEKSFKSKPQFENATIEALDHFCDSLFNLYLSPRLREPVWLSMMTSTTKKGELCTTFLREFMYLVEKFNPKNKFVSCLVTAVLTQHLAWVPTVVPAGGTPSRTYLDKHSAKWLDALAKSHPYNPLWAQLSDLYGAIGFPLKLSRTVVVGKKQDIIRRLLYVLSYFIRCSEVFEAVEEPDQCHLDSLEVQACTQEIMIPSTTREDGSIKSAGSLFMHSSAMSCSNCGSVIENPYRGGRQYDSVTSSPNVDSTSTHGKWTTQKHALRSPPLMQDENYFEFGQKRTLKSPINEENLFDFSAKQGAKKPQTVQEQPVFGVERSKSFVNPAEPDDPQENCLSYQEPWAVGEYSGESKSTSAVENCVQFQESEGSNVEDLCSENDVNVFKSDENDCTLIESNQRIQDYGEDTEARSEPFTLSDNIVSTFQDSEGKSRFRCPLLFTLVEKDEYPEGLTLPSTDSAKHGRDLEIAVNTGETVSFESQNEISVCKIIPTEVNCNGENSSLELSDAILSGRVRSESDITVSQEADAPSIEGHSRESDDIIKEKSATRTQSEGAVTGSSSVIYPTISIPRHHSDSTFLQTNNPLEKTLCTDGKLKYKIRDNLYPDLSSLKQQEGLQTPEDKAEMRFPLPVTATSLREEEKVDAVLVPDQVGNESYVSQSPVLHRVKLRNDKIGATVVPLENQVSSEEKSCEEVKTERVRHVGKQSIGSIHGNMSNSAKTMSRDSGIEDSCERTGDPVKSLCLDSGVYDDFVFKTDETYGAKHSEKMFKFSKKHSMVLRSFSSDSQNSFSEYENVSFPNLEDLDAVKCKKLTGRHALQRLVSEGNTSLFDEYFEEHVGEIPLFGQTSEDAQSEQNTISESVDGERALSEKSGNSESTEGHPVCADQDHLPQEVDKSILFDRISHTPVFESCEPLANSLVSDEFDSEHVRNTRSTLSWDEGMKRRDMYDDICSSVTDSDVTDLEGSLCSECTVKADRSGGLSGRHRRHTYKRQSSIPSTGTPGRTSTPGRTRSVTPTELNRRRHASALSSSTQDQADSDGQAPTTSSLEHMVMPSFLTGDDTVVPSECNFGHSLLAGFSPHYLSDFTLHGTSDPHFHTRLHQDLTQAVQNPVLDESITEAACVVADTDKWNVKVLSCHYSNSDRMKTQEIAASKIISDIIESVYHLWKLKMSPEFCLMHLEDRLQEVYFKSRMLSEYLRFHRKIDHKELAAMLGFDPTDLPLLLAVAGTHTPYFALGLLS